MLQNPFTRTPAKIAVIGLGYVGLPLAVAFAAEHEVVGFDIKPQRIAELASGEDRTLEVSALELAACAVVGTLFVRRQRVLAAPMLPVDLFRRPVFALTVATSVCFVARSSSLRTPATVCCTCNSRLITRRSCAASRLSWT